MKTLLRKLLSLALALLVCLLPMAVQAESLFNERSTKAFDVGSALTVAIGVELDDNLGALGLLPQESFAAIQKVLSTTTLWISIAQGSAGLPEVSLELRIGETPIANGRAWLADEHLAVVTSLLPGKTLLIDATELFKEFEGMGEQLTALGEDLGVLSASIESCVAIIVDWASTTEGLVSASEETTEAIPWQDASVQSLTLRVTPGQLKELLTKLTKELAKVEGQTKIISVNATSLEDIEALKPTDNAMEWIIRMDAQGGIAAIEGAVPAMFEGSAAEGVIGYQHFTANSAQFPLMDTSHEMHNFVVKVTEEGVGSSSASVSVAAAPDAPKGSVNILIHQSDKVSSTIIALDHNYAGTQEADRETLESQTSLKVQQIPNSPAQPGDSDAVLSGMEATTLLSARADLTSETWARGEDGFLCESTLGISLMDIPLGRMLVTSSSSAYASPDIRGNETVDLAALDEERGAALNEELNAGLEQAIALAMSQSPELLQLVMMMRQ